MIERDRGGLIETLCHVVGVITEQIRVHVQSHCRGRVTEHALNGPHVGAGGDGQARLFAVCVAEPAAAIAAADDRAHDMRPAGWRAQLSVQGSCLCGGTLQDEGLRALMPR